MVYISHDHARKEACSQYLGQVGDIEYKGRKEKRLCRQVMKDKHRRRGTNNKDGECDKSEERRAGGL